MIEIIILLLYFLGIEFYLAINPESKKDFLLSTLFFLIFFIFFAIIRFINIIRAML